MHRATDSEGRKRFMHGALLIVAVSFLAGGWKSYSKGAFDGPKGQFGVDGPQTLAYLRGLEFTIDATGDSIVIQRFTCVNSRLCPVGGVRLMFVPEQDAEKRDWESAMLQNKAGHVVAMVINVDTVSFPDLGLPPGGRAYAWVGQNGPLATDRGFGVFRLDNSGRKAASWFLTKEVSHCDDSKTRLKPAIKTAHPGISSCVRINSAAPAAGTFASRTTTSVSAAFAPSLWISCSGGCCEVKGN